MSHVRDANRYVQDVVDGRVLACKWVRLACRRHLEDLERAGTGDFPYEFDEAKANRACAFIELLPHTKGRWAVAKPGQKGSTLLKLEPWQKFILCSVFGWVHEGTGFRRFRIVYVCVPRKNGKSGLAAGIGLYMFAADGEYGAEVYSGATSEKQAWEVFRPAKLMAERTPELCEAFGIATNAKNLHIHKNGSRFEPVIGKPGDGASPSCAIIDEYHEHESDELFDTMLTGMGAREQPIELVITTAGENIAGPCYALQSDVQKMLEGTIIDEELFGVVYSVDEDDDWTSEEALRKANPNFDVSVGADFLKSRQAEALRSSRKQGIFKTKHLNIWVQARNAWMNMEAWRRLGDSTLQREDFAGDPCWKALDLANKLDLTADVSVFRREIEDEPHFYVFGRYYVPEETAQDPDKRHYQGWAADGHLTLTNGSIIDYDAIRDGIVEDAGEIQELAYDPWSATQLALQLQEEHGITVVEVPQTVARLSEPMKWLEAMVLDGRIHHDGSPVLTWAMSNVVARVDAKENIYPRKERPENKIDPVVSLIMALSRAMLNQTAEKSVYETRGVLSF